MAKVTLSPLVVEIHGKFDNLVFRRTRRGGISIIRKADMSQVEWSPAQSAHRQRFKAAIVYARSAMADPQQRRTYETLAKKKGKRAFEMAVSDYFQKNAE